MCPNINPSTNICFTITNDLVSADESLKCHRVIASTPIKDTPTKVLETSSSSENLTTIEDLQCGFANVSEEINKTRMNDSGDSAYFSGVSSSQSQLSSS